VKKLLLLIGILFVSAIGFSETLNGSFVPRIHQVAGDIALDTNAKEIVIYNFTYDGKGKNVYIVLSKGGDFKNMKVVSKELKTAYVNEDLKLKVNNLAKLVDQGYTTISVYTKKYKSSFGDATLSE
jgi:hypothetical protein